MVSQTILLHTGHPCDCNQLRTPSRTHFHKQLFFCLASAGTPTIYTDRRSVLYPKIFMPQKFIMVFFRTMAKTIPNSPVRVIIQNAPQQHCMQCSIVIVLRGGLYIITGLLTFGTGNMKFYSVVKYKIILNFEKFVTCKLARKNLHFFFTVTKLCDCLCATTGFQQTSHGNSYNDDLHTSSSHEGTSGPYMVLTLGSWEVYTTAK